MALSSRPILDRERSGNAGKVWSALGGGPVLGGRMLLGRCCTVWANRYAQSRYGRGRLHAAPYHALAVHVLLEFLA